jgi:hypothetical protein
MLAWPIAAVNEPSLQKVRRKNAAEVYTEKISTCASAPTVQYRQRERAGFPASADRPSPARSRWLPLAVLRSTCASAPTVQYRQRERAGFLASADRPSPARGTEKARPLCSATGTGGKISPLRRLRRMSLLLTHITPMSLGRASGPLEGGQRCNLWTHRRKRRRVEDAQEKLWRLSKARMCSPPDARRCTSGYLLIGVCRRRGSSASAAAEARDLFHAT